MRHEDYKDWLSDWYEGGHPYWTRIWHAAFDRPQKSVEFTVGDAVRGDVMVPVYDLVWDSVGEVMRDGLSDNVLVGMLMVGGVP